MLTKHNMIWAKMETKYCDIETWMIHSYKLSNMNDSFIQTFKQDPWKLVYAVRIVCGQTDQITHPWKYQSEPFSPEMHEQNVTNTNNWRAELFDKLDQHWMQNINEHEAQKLSKYLTFFFSFPAYFGNIAVHILGFIGKNTESTNDVNVKQSDHAMSINTLPCLYNTLIALIELSASWDRSINSWVSSINCEAYSEIHTYLH